jgi:hypothetical protein
VALDTPVPGRLRSIRDRRAASSMNHGCLHIALTRPDRLVEALALALRARNRYSSCHLVYEASAWWRHTGLEGYRRHFERVSAIHKVTGNRGLRDLPRHYRELKARQRRLADLDVQTGDSIVCLAGITGLANAMASAYPAIPKVLCVSLKKYVDASRAPDFRRYRHTTSSWLQNHLLEPASGVGRTLHLKPWRSRGGDGVRLERLEQPLTEVFQGIAVLSNSGTELPANGGAGLFSAPFPHLRELAELLPPAAPEPAGPRQVVFFGTPFLLVRNLPPAEYAEILNRCLDFLRRHYGGTCRLHYRPHPAEKEELGWLRLDGFLVEDDQEVAELYLLRESRAIEAVYSVSSTVSRVACNFGLNAYCLWRCFPFAPSAAAYFESLMGLVPPEFEIRSLERAPIPYARASGACGPAASAGKDFAGTVLRALESVAGASSNAGAPGQNPFARLRNSPV